MCVTEIVCTVYFVFIIFACVALNHTDVGLFYSACGYEFRNFILADLIVGIAIPTGCAIFMSCFRYVELFRCIEPMSCVLVGGVLAVCCCAVSVYLGYFTLALRDGALSNAECTLVMKSIDNWFDHSSTDRGSSLLAVVAAVYGVMYSVLAAAILCCLVFVGYKGVVYALRWRSSSKELYTFPWDPDYGDDV